jgi:hypothetical protein
MHRIAYLRTLIADTIMVSRAHRYELREHFVEIFTGLFRVEVTGTVQKIYCLKETLGSFRP